MLKSPTRSEYRIAAVSRLSGLPADTIRAWERRYGFVQPARDSAGIRRYSEEEVARLALGRQVTELGHPIGQVAGMADEEMRAIIAGAAGVPAAPFAGGSAEALVRSVIGAVQRYDADRAERWLEAAAALLSPESLVLDVLAPLMRNVGESWRAGDLSIAQEHMISGLVNNIVAQLKRRMSRREDRVSIVFATPPNDPHAFGIELAACLAVVRGARTCVLGANVPAQEVLRTAEQWRPSIVVIGSTLPPSLGDFDAYIEELDGNLSPQVQLWIGGPGGCEAHMERWSPRVRYVATLEQFLNRL